MTNFFKNPRFYKASGFTLLELMVVIAMSVLLIAVVTSQNRTHTSRILYDDVAHKIALSIRQVQSYGISSREYTNVGGGGNSFCSGYGVVFILTGGVGTTYQIFADIPAAGPTGFICSPAIGPYDGGDPILETITLKRGNVSRLCATDPSASTPEDCSLASLSIVYQRPNPEPVINGDARYVSARIVLSFPGSITKEIIIRNTGQISVQ